MYFCQHILGLILPLMWLPHFTCPVNMISCCRHDWALDRCRSWGWSAPSHRSSCWGVCGYSRLEKKVSFTKIRLLFDPNTFIVLLNSVWGTKYSQNYVQCKWPLIESKLINLLRNFNVSRKLSCVRPLQMSGYWMKTGQSAMKCQERRKVLFSPSGSHDTVTVF